MSDGDNPIQAAQTRIENAIATLRNLQRHSWKLQQAAQAVVASEELLSACSLIYDALYEASQLKETIGRRPRNQFPPKNAKGI